MTSRTTTAGRAIIKSRPPLYLETQNGWWTLAAAFAMVSSAAAVLYFSTSLKKKYQGRLKGGAEVLVWIYTEIYIVEWASLFLVIFDICQKHWNVSQSAGIGRCWFGMAASHWHMDWCISKRCCLFYVLEKHFKKRVRCIIKGVGKRISFRTVPVLVTNNRPCTR